MWPGAAHRCGVKNQWPDLALKNPRNLGRSRDSCFVNRKFSRIEINHAHLSYARPGLELFGRALIGKPVKITSSARFPFSSGPRTRIKSSTCTYFANSSSFAFFASSAASTGGNVGEKGTGDVGPFFFFPRRRFLPGDFFSSVAGAGAAVVSFGPPFTAGVVFVRRRTGAGAAAAPPAALRGRLRLLFEPLRTSLTEGEDIGLSGGAGACCLGAGGAASLALRLRVRLATESAGGAWASSRASGSARAAESCESATTRRSSRSSRWGISSGDPSFISSVSSPPCDRDTRARFGGLSAGVQFSPHVASLNSTTSPRFRASPSVTGTVSVDGSAGAGDGARSGS